MDSDNPTVQPTVHEVGPYYYAVTWNYTDLVRVAALVHAALGANLATQTHLLNASCSTGRRIENC